MLQALAAGRSYISREPFAMWACEVGGRGVLARNGLPEAGDGG